MAHTDKDEVLALAIFNIVVANKVALQLDDVLYGDHIVIPHASAAVIMALGKRRSLAGVAAPGGRTLNNLMVQIDLHWSKVGDESTERQAADNRGSALETLIHSDTTVGGLVIHGYITQVTRGTSEFASSGMFRSVRMIFEGQTKTYL